MSYVKKKNDLVIKQSMYSSPNGDLIAPLVAKIPNKVY